MKPSKLHAHLLKRRGNHAIPHALPSRSNKDSQPIFSYLMVRYGNSQIHMVETTDHAALRIGGSFGVQLMRAVAASSVFVTRDGPEPDGKFPTHASR